MIPRLFSIPTALLMCASLMPLGGFAQPPWPDPLTLKQALALADGAHPELDQVEARRDEAIATQALAESAQGWEWLLQGRLRFADAASAATDQRVQDHKAGLVLRRELYDFGRTDAAIAAARAGVEEQEWRLQERLQARRLEVARRFFDVLLADLTYARDNEAMSTAYIRFDRARERNQRGQLSDVEMARLESIYQRARQVRYVSESRQRASRERLAITLNRPGQPPGELEPEFDWTPPPLPETPDTWIERALEANPGLLALRARVRSASRRMESIQAQNRGRLTGEAEAAAYTKDSGGRDPLSVGIFYQLPLSSGGRIEAETAQARARLQALHAELAQAELELRQGVLEDWLDLENLRIRGEELEVQTQFRELNMDRARVLYELQKQADLGDSMVLISDLELEQARRRFDAWTTWARLDARIGKTVVEQPGEGP